MDARGQRQRNAAWAIAVAAVTVTVLLLLARPPAPDDITSASADDGKAALVATSAATPSSQTFTGQLRGTGDTATHEFDSLMADGTLTIACTYNQQGVNPGVGYVLEIREGDDDWTDAGSTSCPEGISRQILGPSSARVRVYVDGGLCVCDYTLDVSYKPQTAVK